MGGPPLFPYSSPRGNPGLGKKVGADTLGLGKFALSCSWWLRYLHSHVDRHRASRLRLEARKTWGTRLAVRSLYFLISEMG